MSTPLPSTGTTLHLTLQPMPGQMPPSIQLALPPPKRKSKAKEGPIISHPKKEALKGTVWAIKVFPRGVGYYQDGPQAINLPDKKGEQNIPRNIHGWTVTVLRESRNTHGLMIRLCEGPYTFGKLLLQAGDVLLPGASPFAGTEAGPQAWPWVMRGQDIIPLMPWHYAHRLIRCHNITAPE